MYIDITKVNSLVPSFYATYKTTSIPIVQSRINNFFDEMSSDPRYNRPLSDLTPSDVEKVLQKLQETKNLKPRTYNSYKNIISSFFKFTYERKITVDIASKLRQVTEPVSIPSILSDEEQQKLESYISDLSSPILDRLLLGLFLFTGFKRQFVHKIKSSNFQLENGLYNLKMKKSKDEERIIPLCVKLQVLIQEYVTQIQMHKENEQVFNFASGETLTVYVQQLTTNIIGHAEPPSTLANTFISNLLKSCYNPYLVARLTLVDKPELLDKYIKFSASEIYLQQVALLARCE